MAKGALVAFGIMVALALIPVVHLVGIPFGPFIGGYFGVTFARDQPGSYSGKGVRFGALLALVALVVSSLVSVVLMLVLGLSRPMLVLAWLAVGVFTLYTGTMGTLGAMFSLLRAERASSKLAAVNRG